MRENNLEEVEALTKRFKDYIDKFQVTLEKVYTVLPKSGKAEADASEKFYTVVSPVDVMANNMKSVLTVLEEAIVNIEKISDTSADGVVNPAETTAADEKSNSGLPVSNRIFLSEELEFLEKTFNKILNASAKERSRIFEDLDKISNS